MKVYRRVKIFQSGCFPKIHYKEQYFYCHHENGLIRVTSSCTNPLFQYSEGVHLTMDLTLPPPNFSVQVKSGACYITGQRGRVQNKPKPKPKP